MHITKSGLLADVEPLRFLGEIELFLGSGVWEPVHDIVQLEEKWLISEHESLVE